VTGSHRGLEQKLQGVTERVTKTDVLFGVVLCNGHLSFRCQVTDIILFIVECGIARYVCIRRSGIILIP